MQIVMDKDQMDMVRGIIRRIGSVAKFSKYHGIPNSTVRDWYYGYSNPPQWLIDMVDRATPKKDI